MKILSLILLFLFSHLSVLAQKKNKDSLKFILNIRAQFEKYDPPKLDTTMLCTFIIKNSRNQIDTLYSTDTNYVEMQLEPETNYNVVLINNIWNLPSYTSISIKGLNKSKVFFEDIYIREIEPDLNYDPLHFDYKLNNFTTPYYSQDSLNSPFKELYTLLTENNEVIKTLLLSGHRYKNEKKISKFKKSRILQKRTD